MSVDKGMCIIGVVEYCEQHQRYTLKRIETTMSLCRVIAIGIIATGFAVAANLVGANPAVIKPSLTGKVSQKPQPIGGEIRFSATPELTKPCTLRVELVNHLQSNETMVFRVTKGDIYTMPIFPDTVVWEAPIDSGAVKSFSFVFTPTLVGSHKIAFEKKNERSWSAIGTIFFAISEDGKTICAGPTETCRTTLVPPHSRQNEVPIVVEFPINQWEAKRLQDRHFSSTFKITPRAGFKDTVFVDFDLECHVSLYTQVQFVVEHSTNIAVSKLPESWGDKAGPAKDYRHLSGRFAFVPLKAGLSQLTFQVLGKHPLAMGGGRINTDFAMYVVIGEAGGVLFAGDFDPYTRYKDAADPMIGSLKSILSVAKGDFRTRLAISQPDFRGLEVDARDGVDSAAADTAKKTE